MHGRAFLRTVLLIPLVSLATAFAVVGARGGLSTTGQVSRPAPAPRSGDEIMVVLLISETCPGAQDPEFRAGVRRAMAAVTDRALETGHRAVFVGVSLSSNTTSARRFIGDFAQFDEIVVGRGWLNSQAIRLFWRDSPGPAGVPQLVLMRRRIDVENGTIQVGRDSLLMRLTGVDEINRWSTAGAPLAL